MFRETIVHKWDIVTIHSRLLYTIPRMLNTRYRFYSTSSDHVQDHWFCCTIECQSLPGLPPLWKIIYCNLFLHWSVEQICGLKVFWGWMVPDGCFQPSFDLGKYTVIIDGTNFMAASENSLGVWTTIWPDFTFRKMTFLMVPPTSSIGTLPWCPSL